MIVFVSGATVDVSRSGPDVGVLIVPGQRNSLDALQIDRRPWAVDNAAFSDFDAAAYLDLLQRVRGRSGCHFVAVPDRVADAGETRRLFDQWAPIVAAYGLPLAFVAQDGVEARGIPWPQIQTLFIGGSTDWKLSRHVDTLLAYAAALGKWRHVGRVNSRRRMRHFFGLADSFDGSGFSRWPKRIALASRWTGEFRRQPRLHL